MAVEKNWRLSRTVVTGARGRATKTGPGVSGDVIHGRHVTHLRYVCVPRSTVLRHRRRAIRDGGDGPGLAAGQDRALLVSSESSFL